VSDGTSLESAASVLDELRGARDAISVGKVFGDAYEIGDTMIIPVARVAGGGGGGGGEDANEKSGGFGTGFGLRAHPVGVYEVRAGKAQWRPSVDVNRVIRGGQVLAGIGLVCLTLVVLGRLSATALRR
jgi:uncharacterized spore protein YtfJ